MRLPHVESAVVPQEKVVEYLLSMTHPTGRHKASFFISFGFTPDRWEELSEALLRHASDHEIAKQERTPFGTRYVVQGTMEMADARDALIRTVWFVDIDTDVPRFVTAYPWRG